MTERRVIIIGAGIAGLTAAHELTRTQRARARWAVEIVEMGHRVGGRLASAHQPDAWHRNEEHGLHVWFGWYDNTFRLAEQVWRDWRCPSDCPWTNIHDALRPICVSEHGFDGAAGMELRRVHMPRNADRPGHVEHRSSIGRVSTWLDLARALSNTWSGLVAGAREPNPASHRLLESLQLGQPSRALDRMVRPSLARFEWAAGERDVAVRLQRGAAVGAFVARMHRGALALALAGARDNPGALALAHALDLALAIVRGVCSLEHRLLEDGDLDRVSAWELSDWLAHHGADASTLRDSRLLECMYDIPFAYRDGDRTKRVLEAGTALRFCYRMFADYKSTLAYLLRAGAGETLVAPLFELLRERGVAYRPFHRLDRVELDRERKSIERLWFVRAARVREGDYDPLLTRGGLRGFRADPDWAQLEDGDALARRGVDFYSHSGDRGESDEIVLERGVDFDDVVLALPLGSIVPDADGHSPVRAWLDAHPPARACLAKLHLVPTVAAQLWFSESPEQLGIEDLAAVTWGLPYSVVCNMSPVIEREAWPSPGPGSCVYACGAWPHTDLADARALLVAQLDAQLGSLGNPTLYAPPGVAPWDAQYVRANIEPWELADLALPGADPVRLEAAQSGLDNLALAGSWVRTPVNSTSVEAAVCSGLAAARALGAEVQPILTEHLLRKPSRKPWLPGREAVHTLDDHARRLDAPDRASGSTPVGPGSAAARVSSR